MWNYIGPSITFNDSHDMLRNQLRFSRPSWNIYTLSWVMEWTKEDDANMDIVSYYCRSLGGVYSILIVMKSQWGLKLPPTTPHTCSAIWLGLHLPQSQVRIFTLSGWWSSPSPRRMMQVWICYPTIIWVLKVTWSIPWQQWDNMSLPPSSSLYHYYATQCMVEVPGWAWIPRW